MKLYLFTLALLIGLLATTAPAHTTMEDSFTCPIDGNQWKQMVDMTGSTFGHRLDLKPLGATAAPWTAPQCPKCRFVLYKSEPADIPTDKLKPYILSESYQSATKDQPTYFCIALIQTFLGATPQAIGDAYLKASWQTEANPKECRKHLESALTHFATALTTLKSDSPEFQTYAILCCELERRTGRFDAARKRCDTLLQTEGFKAANLQQVLKRESEFIAKKDSAPHAMTTEQERLL